MLLQSKLEVCLYTVEAHLSYSHILASSNHELYTPVYIPTLEVQRANVRSYIYKGIALNTLL